MISPLLFWLCALPGAGLIALLVAHSLPDEQEHR